MTESDDQEASFPFARNETNIAQSRTLLFIRDQKDISNPKTNKYYIK